MKLKLLALSLTFALGALSAQTFAQYPIAPTAPNGDNSQKIANTAWVNTAIAAAANTSSGVLLSSCAKGTGGDDAANIQTCMNTAATASKTLYIDTPTYTDPQGNAAWLVCASPNADGHGVEIPATIQIVGLGARIEIQPTCANPPSEVLYAPNGTSTSRGTIKDLIVDGYGLANAVSGDNWARFLLDHVLFRNGKPGSVATFLNDSNANDLSVCCDSRIENANDTNHTIYWGSRIYAAASAGQNQIVLPSIPAGLVQKGAVVLPEANGHTYTCTATAGSYFLTACNTINGMTVGDRIILAGGGTISTTLGANAAQGATTITLASVNGVGPGDLIAIAGAGTSGGTLNTTVSSFPTAGTQPAGTISIANAIVTAVSSGAAATVTTPFYTDIQAIEPAGCVGLCVQVALPPTVTGTVTVVDPTPGYNLATTLIPSSFAVAYACQISGTTVSLSTSPTDTTCAAPYNLPIAAIAGEWITNLPVFAAADNGADSEWDMFKAVSGARAEFVELQNEGDPKVSHAHVFGPPPLNGLYGVEFTGGGSCYQCQNDRAQWAAAKLGNKSNLENARFDGFIMENAFPTATLQQVGVRIDTVATAGAGVQMTGFQQMTGSSQYLTGAQVILQAGVADPSSIVKGNNGASFVTEGVICKANWNSGGQPTVTNSTGTTVETYFNGCLIPGGVLGPNDALEISALWSFNNTATAKTPKIKFDAAPGSLTGTSYSSISSGTGGAVSQGCTILVRNYGATNAQVAMPSSAACPSGNSTSATTTGARDTTAPFWVDFSCSTSTNGDTCSELSYTVAIKK